MNFGEHLAGADGIAPLPAADDADCVVDRVVLRPAAGSEMERSTPDGDRAEARDVARPRRFDVRDDACLRESILPRAPPCAAIQRSYRSRAGPVRDGCVGAPAALVLVDPQVGQGQQPGGRVEDELGEVRRPVATQGRDRLANLQAHSRRRSPAARPCPSAGRHLPAGAFPEREHDLREDACVGERLHERPSPTLTSRTIASAPPAIFFDMMLAAINETMSTVAVTSRSA